MPTSSDPLPPLKPAAPAGISPAAPRPGKLAKAIKAAQNQARRTAAQAPAAVPVPAAQAPAAPLGQTAADPPLVLKPAPKPAPKPQPTPAPPIPEDERPSRERLKGFAAAIAQRVKDIEEIFGGATYSPLKNDDFKKFLGDQVAEVAMRYVRIGVVSSEDADAITPDERERRMVQKGFSVGQAAAAASAEKNDTIPEDSASSTGPMDQHDANFVQSPAFQLARDLGLDLSREDD